MKHSFTVERRLAWALGLALALATGARGGTTGPLAKGADASWVTQMEASGYTWQNRDGTPADVFAILKNLGLNAIRLRVWVNPANGWNNKADVIAKAVRANNLGLRLLIDFHYSDTWADPGHQTKPAAWTSYPTAQLVNGVSNHTYEVLSGLQAAGVTAEWVQVGNEIACGMLWPDGYACGSTNNTTNLAALINSGYAAVKAVNPATLVVIHLNNGQNSSRWWFDPMVARGIQFDVIGLSLYPATDTNWMSDANGVLANMLDLASRYGKPVMIAETGMSVTDAQLCQNMLVDLMNKVRSVPNHQGLGLFYWEPEAYAYWGWCAWNGSGNAGRPTIAMDAFAYEPNQPPGSPALTAANLPARVSLAWTVPVGATNYNVKRATVGGGPYSTLASLAATNYTDTGIVSGSTYYYVVSAVNAFGEGTNSAPVSLTPHGSPPLGATLPAGLGQVSLSWPGWATQYSVYAATNLLGAGWQAVTNVPQSSNGLFYLSLPVTHRPQQFFRLIAP